MPYMQRLTWQGIALHGGDLPRVSGQSRLHPVAEGVCQAALLAHDARHDRDRDGRESAGADPDRAPRHDLVAAGGRRVTADGGQL